MERGLERWRGWNRAWPEPLFHETGVLFASRAPLSPGGFEHDSLRLLEARGHRIERLAGAELRRRFPSFGDGWVDGYFNPAGGWAESGRVVAALAAQARAAGVEVLEGARVDALASSGSRVVGALLASGERVEADTVLVAGGAWTQALVPQLGGLLRATGQPVFHLRPADPSSFAAPRFAVFGADIAKTGWYGFCANADGIVKIANHGVGRPVDPTTDLREVAADDEVRLRAFLATTFPSLAGAPIVHTRLCVYGDSADEHFVIDADPDRPGLVVAAGGSGHGFKFAPMLGELAADAVEGRHDQRLERFRWRTRAPGGQEAARHRG